MTFRTFAVVSLAVLAVAVAGCGGGSSNPVTSTPVNSGGGGASVADVTITISGFSFGSASVKAGQTVSWRNADSVSHTATADGGEFNTGTIAPGATSKPIMMSAAASISYHCVIHPNMTSTLSVTQ